VSKYNSLHIILLYITHTYIILFARHPSRVLRGSFSFPSVQLFVTIRAAAVCGWRPFLENGIFSLSVSLSLLHDPAGYVLIQSYLSCPIVSTIANARAREPKPAYTGIRHTALTRGTDARAQHYEVISYYVGNRGIDTYNVVHTAVIYVYIIFIG